MEDGDSGQVGGAGGEGLAATTDRMDVQDRNKNEDIGSEDYKQCTHLIEGGKAEKQQVWNAYVGA